MLNSPEFCEERSPCLMFLDSTQRLVLPLVDLQLEGVGGCGVEVEGPLPAAWGPVALVFLRHALGLLRGRVRLLPHLSPSLLSSNSHLLLLLSYQAVTGTRRTSSPVTLTSSLTSTDLIFTANCKHRIRSQE